MADFRLYDTTTGKYASGALTTAGGPIYFSSGSTPGTDGAVDYPKLKTYGEPKAMIASGAAVATPASFFFSSATVPTVGGDMKTQAFSALEALKSRLEEAKLGFKDVVFLRAYVVPNKDGTVDRNGWTAAYSQYFNNPQQPHKPARTTIPVTSLPKPEWSIAIDVVAVAPWSSTMNRPGNAKTCLPSLAS